MNTEKTGKNVLVLSPHPDDEAIGCGGAICNHVAAGDKVSVIFLTSGEKGGHGKGPDETAQLREAEARAAAVILNVADIEFWRQPDGAVAVTNALVSKLNRTMWQNRTDLVYVPHFAEAHPDHQAAAHLVKNAISSLEARYNKPAVWMYEVWTPIQKIDHVLDISEYVAIKQQAILAHKCQCDVLRFDVSALALNRYRGEMHSWPGGDYAEVFEGMKFAR